jgi:aspartyl-tRNA(Asn)/glutamyl-tRNA(Gln) amidotransferase subunit B
MNKYETVIGLEIHVQLKTKSKMFCPCDNSGEFQMPNTTICPVCTGQPGTLPVINKQAVRWAVMAGLALGCEINKKSHFDRKSYFYPDLPKGYQISQYAAPFGHDGFVVITLPSGHRRVRIERVHLEEDTGKLMHDPDKNASYVDYNRAGTPLLEVVTKPDIQTPEEAKIFLKDLRLIMRYLGVSDADMELGHLRCDANVSLRPNPEYFLEKTGEKDKLYPKTEIKNLNSFTAVERALAYEIERQSKLWEEDKAPQVQSTRGWDDNKGATVEQRTKEEQYDYRYFPEPDLPPVIFTDDKIAEIKSAIAESPFDKKERFKAQLGLGEYDAALLVGDKKLGNFFEEVVSELKAWLVSLEEVEGTEEEIWRKHKAKLVKMVANWLINRLLSLLPEKRFSVSKIRITPENFAELITLIYQHRINQQIAFAILKKMAATGGDPSDIMSEENLGQTADADDLERVITLTIKNNPAIVEQYKAGKTAVLQFLIGQVMKQAKGRADAQKVKDSLVHRLK